MCAYVFVHTCVCLFPQSAKQLSAVSAVFISEATGETQGTGAISLSLSLSALKIDIEHRGGAGEKSHTLVAIS